MDDEIIVNVNRKPSSNTSKNKPNKSKKKGSKNNKKENSKKPKMRKKVKIVFCIILAIILLALLLCSPLFNIKYFEVNGNTEVSDEKIISLSELQIGNNIFNINKLSTIEKIMGNAYVKDADISRKLPSTVVIDIEERQTNYMLQFADSYVYINNQGYMLEISNEKLEVPILIGFTTDLSNIKAGNRINLNDLKKMDMVIKIYETTKSNELGHLVSKIDISNEKNYTLILDSEAKKVYLGDCSDLNTRILFLKDLLEKTSGHKGEIFLNVDLNERRPYFRPSSD